MNLLDLARSALPPVAVTATPSGALDLQRQRVLGPVAEVSTTRVVIAYDLIDGKGGLLIDPDGAVSGVRELHWRFGDRLNWPALLHHFQLREQDADREAAALIRRVTRKEIAL